MLRTANHAVDGLAELPADRTLLLDNVPKGSLVRVGGRLRRKGVGVCVCVLGRRGPGACHMAAGERL